MDPRLKEAQQLDKETRELELRLREEYVEIGRRAGLGHAKTLQQASAARDLDRMKDVQKRHEALQQDAEKILKNLADLEEAENKHATLKDQLDKAMLEYEAAAKDLGKASAQLYGTLTLPDTYASYFEPIAKANKEIEKLEKELATIETEEKSKGFFGKLVSKGKSMGVRSAVGKQQETKQDYYAQLGRMLVDTSFSDHLSGDARALFDTVKRQKGELAALQKQIGDLQLVQEERRAALKQLCGGADPRARGRELEKQLSAAQDEMDVLHVSIAEALVGDKSYRPTGDPSLADRISYANSLRAAIEDRKTRIAQLRAALEIEELQSREKAFRRKREQIESEIRIRQDQIKAIDAEIDKAQKRIEELKRSLS